MSDAKHTPGPWHIRDGEHEGEYHVCAPGATVAVCDARPAEECEANARLIAAAPELLAALKRLVKRIDQGERITPDLNVMVTTRAAIAKAEAE